MKNERTILVVFLILISIIAFTVFRYVSFLREQNNVLSMNIDQIVKTIAVIESDKATEKIVALKAENTGLRKQIKDLKAELSRIPKKLPKIPVSTQEAKPRIKKEKTVTGNQGFLMKSSKPAP